MDHIHNHMRVILIRGLIVERLLELFKSGQVSKGIIDLNKYT